MNDRTMNAWCFDAKTRAATRVSHLWEYCHSTNGFYPRCHSMAWYSKAKSLEPASGEFRKCKKCIRYEERLQK